MFRGEKLLAAAFAIAGITLLSSSSDAMNLKYNKGPPTGIATAVAPTPTLGSSAAYTFVESGDNTGSYTTQYNYNTYIRYKFCNYKI